GWGVGRPSLVVSGGTGGSLMRRSHGQPSQPYSVFFDYDNASCIESRGESWQVEGQEPQLLCRMTWRPSEKDDGGLCLRAQGENTREVGIRGNKHTLLRSCAVEDHFVRCRLQTVLSNV